MLVKYLIIYLFDAASVLPVNQLLVCSMHINIGQLLICSMHFIVEIDWHILVIIRFDSMGDLSLSWPAQICQLSGDLSISVES